MIRFSPQWQTSNADPLDTLSEGDVFSASLEAIDYAAFSKPYSSTLILTLPSSASGITSVRINGNELDSEYIEASGKTLTLLLSTLGLSGTLMIELVRDKPLTYSLLRGELPDGLTLSDDTISGTVGNIIGTGSTVFDFTIRCSNGEKVKDRTFSIIATSVLYDTVWDVEFTEDTDDDLDIDYYVLGSFQRAETINIPLPWSDLDNDGAIIELLSTGLTGDFIEGLPPGILLTQNGLEGTLVPNIQAGRYLFRLGFSGQSTNRIFCEIIALDTLSSAAFDPLSVVSWETPTGSLGSITETHPCTFSVKAAAGELEVSYSLSSGSGPLPPGITLNPLTGDLQGFAAHVTSNQTFSFIVRATTVDGYLDRSFSIMVVNLYNTANVLEVRLRLGNSDNIGIRDYYLNAIPETKRYRSRDRNFGVPEPYVYLIKGLLGTSVDAAQTGDGETGPFSESYHSEFPVIIGAHKYAVARNSTGNVIYEAIYRKIIDPQAKAGGFSFQSNSVVEDKVLWPQSGDTPLYIYPRSFRNARYDMVRDLGFATDDEDLVSLPGLSGVEALPRWMTSEQVRGDSSSILGFIPAMLVGYTLPGKAKTIINDLDKNTILPIGRRVIFGRYFSFDYQILVSTSFDDNLTTFDDGSLVFDAG